MRYLVRALCLCALVMGLLLPSLAPTAAPDFADPAIKARWNADEALVPGYWGAPITGGLFEPYESAPGGIRLVQYFERGRIELAVGQVSSDALVLNMFRGRIDIGHLGFDTRPVPDLPIAGDAGINLTYAAAAAVLPAFGKESPKQIGMSVATVVSPSGVVSSLPVTPATGPESIGEYDITHNVLQAFADFRDHAYTPPSDTSRTSFARTNSTGFAITEPFRTTVTTNGVARDVIMQLFGNRVLIYDPNVPEGSRVEIVNTGQTYYNWRYANTTPQPATGPLPAPVALPDAKPGPVTLAAGGVTQTGKNGYANWCQSDASGRVRTAFIADTFDYVTVPTDALSVLKGDILTFTYGGADPLRVAYATFYPLAKAGMPNQYGQVQLPRGADATGAAVTLQGSQVTLNVSVPPDEYLMLVQIIPAGTYMTECEAEFQFHVRVQ